MNAETKIKLIRKILCDMYEADYEVIKDGVLFAIDSIVVYGEDNEES